MTAAAIRVPRRLVRKLLKPALLWLNAHRYKHSENEVYRLTVTAESLRRAAGRESIHQVKLQEQRRRIGGW
jgi:ribosomal protein L28